MNRAWSRFDGVLWDRVDWLFAHPEHIDRERPSREEEIALQRVWAGDPLLLPLGAVPTLPPPLEHFDKPRHHRRPEVIIDTDHEFLRSALGRWFAGFRQRPSPEELREYLLAPTMEAYPDSRPRQVLYNLFNCIGPAEMMVMQVAERMTIHELVRAVHHSGALCSPLMRRLEPYADPPLRPRYLDVMEKDKSTAGGR